MQTPWNQEVLSIWFTAVSPELTAGSGTQVGSTMYYLLSEQLNECLRHSLKSRRGCRCTEVNWQASILGFKEAHPPTPGTFGSQPHPVFLSFLLLALTSTILIKRFYLNFLQEGEFGRANEWPFIPYLLKGKKTYFFPQYHCLKAGFFFEINNSFKSCRKSVTSKRDP